VSDFNQRGGLSVKKLMTLIALLPAIALANPPDWANNDKDRNDPTVVTSSANALAAAAAVSTAEQVQSVSAATGDSTSSATGGSVGAVTATLGSVVESGAVQSSTTVETNYREAAQAVSLVLTTACGTAAGGAGREWTVSVAQGQDAFCKNLALANLYLSLGHKERAMNYIAAAEQLAEIDTFFDNFTTIISLGLLK
jgi:hypothetical protein